MVGWFWGWVELSQWEVKKLQGHQSGHDCGSKGNKEKEEMVETQNLPHSNPSLPSEDRMEQGKKNRMRMNAEGCVLGRLVSEGGEREQETAEWPPSEPDEKCYRLHC